MPVVREGQQGQGVPAVVGAGMRVIRISAGPEVNPRDVYRVTPPLACSL